MKPLMLEEEIQEALALYKVKHPSLSGVQTDQVIRNHVVHQVEAFARPLYAEDRKPYDLWAIRILDKLSEGSYFGPNNPKDFEEVAADFRIRVDEVMEDKQLCLADPDCSTYQMASRFPDEHPWGSVVVAQCLKFLAEVTPWKVFKIYQHIQEIGKEVLAKFLLDLATGEEDGRVVGDQIERAFDEALEEFKKKL